MANKFFDAGEARAAKVNRLFAAVAPRYDLINDLQSLGLHRYWKRRLVTLAEPGPGRRALDLCCGTGDVTFALAAKGAEVIGLDFSAEMLAVAEQRKTGGSSSPARCTFIQGDAQTLPFPDASFDIVTLSYGLRNLASLERGVGEILRVLKPGGRALVLDFGKPDNAVWRALYFAYLRWFVPVFGWLYCGDAATHGYILESLRAYPGQRGVDAKLREAGFGETWTVNLLGGVMSINSGLKSK